jgi:hypothetical protein
MNIRHLYKLRASLRENLDLVESEIQEREKTDQKPARRNLKEDRINKYRRAL